MVATLEEPPIIAAEPADHAKGAHVAYALGIDLGQSIDPTAMALIEREVYGTADWQPIKGQMEGATNWRPGLGVRFTVRALKLLPLGTSYQAIVAEIGMRYEQTAQFGKTQLVFDETGARAAGDMIRERIPNAVGCTLTASEKDARIGPRRWSISKPNMVTGLLAAIESGQLGAAKDLDQFETFKAHIVDLRRKVSNLGHFSFNAREGQHDDFVTAGGLAWWCARHRLWRRAAHMTHLLGL